MTAAELGQRLSSAELMEWLAADALDQAEASAAGQRAELAGAAAAGLERIKGEMKRQRAR